MNIQGIQKLTLLDYPGKVACTLFTAGCNFRCPFCHNAPLVTEIDSSRGYHEEEIFTFLKKRQGILDGVCISGGEPLLQKDIGVFMKKVKELGYLVKLDTNGSFPDKLKELVQDELVDYVAMDIKNAPDSYCHTAGIVEDDNCMDKIKKSVAFLMGNHVPYEFRTTVVKGYHTKKSFEKIGQWIQGCENYFLQSFVDSGELIGKDMEGFEESEMEAFLEAVSPYIPNAQLRGI